MINQLAVKNGGFAADVTTTSFANILIACMGVVTGALAARLLGTTGRGELAVIQLWPTTIATFAMLGLNEALVYYPAKDRVNSAAYVGTSMVIALVAGGVFVIGGFFGIPLLLQGQVNEIVSASRWYLAIIPVVILVGLPYHVFRGLGDFPTWNAIRALPSVGWMLVLLLAAYLRIASAFWLAAGFVCSQAILAIILWKFVVRRVGGSFLPRVSMAKPLLKFGLPSMSTAGPNILAARLDQMILAGFFSPKLLGLYVVALAWGSAATPLLGAIASVTFPRVASSNGDEDRIRHLCQAVRVSMIAASLAVVPVALSAPVMIPLLFGAQFASATKVAMLLAIYGSMSGVRTVLEEGLRGAGHPGRILWAQAVGIPATVVAMLTLVPRFGITGAGIASLIGSASMCCSLFYVVHRELGVPVRRLCVPTIDDLRLIIMHGRKLQVSASDRMKYFLIRGVS